MTCGPPPASVRERRVVGPPGAGLTPFSQFGPRAVPVVLPDAPCPTLIGEVGPQTVGPGCRRMGSMPGRGRVHHLCPRTCRLSPASAIAKTRIDDGSGTGRIWVGSYGPADPNRSIFGVESSRNDVVW